MARYLEKRVVTRAKIRRCGKMASSTLELLSTVHGYHVKEGLQVLV